MFQKKNFNVFRRMYEVEAKSEDFKSRLNSTFEVLATLEATHKQKKVEYDEGKEIEEHLDDINSSNIEVKCNETKDFDFKVPSLNLMKRPAAKQLQNNLDFKNSKIQPDFVVNPEKWKKYSLEDVADSQMSPSANYFAAINFLKQKEKTKNSTHDEFEKFEELADKTELLNDTSLFNKPLGSGGFKKSNEQNNNSKIEKKLLENLCESKEIDEENDTINVEKQECSQVQFFKKKSARKNLRTKVDENENENETLNNKQEQNNNDSLIDINKRDEEHQDIDVDIEDYLC